MGFILRGEELVLNSIRVALYLYFYIVLYELYNKKSFYQLNFLIFFLPIVLFLPYEREP